MLFAHFDQRPFLGRLLKQHGYRVIYLQRKPARQILSGLVAIQSGIHNSKEKVVYDRRYKIDLNDFRRRILSNRKIVIADTACLNEYGFDFTVAHYEDYCTNREVFYKKIFSFLRLPFELPPSSDFVRVIENLKTTIENYDEVAEVAINLGETL